MVPYRHELQKHGIIQYIHHVTTILCHSGAELFDNNLYSAFSR